MLDPDSLEEVSPEDVTLVDAFMGYNILVHGEHAGAIDGVPGHLEDITVELPLEGKGIGRSALRKFIELSREHDETTVTTTSAVHPAMEHILKTEGFSEQEDGVGWVKHIQ